MHTKEEKLDHASYANEILNRLEVQYGNLPKIEEGVNPEDSLPVARQRELTRQLQFMTNNQVLSWAVALDNIFKRGEHWCPNIAEVCFEMKLADKANRPPRPISRVEHTVQTDYAGIWSSSSAEDRQHFFKNFSWGDCPAATRYVAKSWYLKNGWNEDQIKELTHS